MQLIQVHSELKKLKLAIIQTRDVAAYLNLSTAHSSKLLARLAQHGHLVHLNRGWWAFPEKTDPLMLPEYLTYPFPSYISLQTALYYHGMISQIPTVIYAVSLARTRIFKTPLAEISIHHVDAHFFFGFESLGDQQIKIATPEKALLDTLYLSPAKTQLFRRLPELELPNHFNLKKANEMIEKIRSPLRRTMVKKQFEALKLAAG